MFATLTLTAALLAPSAPIPKNTSVSGPAPRVMDLKPGADGKIVFTVNRIEKQKIAVAQGNAILPGGAAPAVLEREVNVTTQAVVTLADLKDLVVTTAGGKTVDAKEAVKQLENGGIVVISADGKPVDAGFLKIFKDDTLVIASPDLIAPVNNFIRPGVRPGIRIQPGVVQPLPAPAGGIQIVPGNIQLLPGVIQVEIAPAIPAPIVVPAEDK